MVRLDDSQLADELVELGVGDLRRVELVVALVVVGDELAQFLGPRHRVGPVSDPSDPSVPPGGVTGDPGAEDRVGVRRVVERDRLARCHPPLGPVESNRQPVVVLLLAPGTASAGHGRCTGPLP